MVNNQRRVPGVNEVRAEDALLMLASLLRSTHNLATALEEAAGGAPTRDSLADREAGAQHRFAGPWGATPLDSVHRTIDQLARAATDHVGGLGALVDGARPALAIRSLVSGLATACTSLWWLLDPAHDLRTRLARGWTVRLDSGGGLPCASSGGGSVADVAAAAAERFGFSLLGTPPAALDERRPATVEVVEAMLAPVATRRRTEFVDAIGGAVADPLGVAGQASPAVASRLTSPRPAGDVTASEDIATLAASALLVYVEASARRAGYFGSEQAKWQAWRVRVHADLA